MDPLNKCQPLVSILRHYSFPVCTQICPLLKQQGNNYNSTVSRRKLVYLLLFPSCSSKAAVLTRTQATGEWVFSFGLHQPHKQALLSYLAHEATMSQPEIWKTVNLAPSPLCSWLVFPGDFPGTTWAGDSCVFSNLIGAHNWTHWEYQSIFDFCSVKSVSKLYILNYFLHLFPLKYL